MRTTSIYTETPVRLASVCQVCVKCVCACGEACAKGDEKGVSTVCVCVGVRVREGDIKKKTSEPSLFILLPRHCDKREKNASQLACV